MDYTQDANCLQAFILDDGTANANDRTSGGRNLTLANGAWGASNDGYVFDADATGSFTPALTNWQGADWTIAILLTVTDATSSQMIYHTYDSGDTDKRIRLQTNPYATDRRIEYQLSREFGGHKTGYTTSGPSTKTWLFIEYDYVDLNSMPKAYHGTTDVSENSNNGEEYGTIAMDTGILGNGSTCTIHQVGVFSRILTGGEKTDIVANGLKSASAPARRRIAPVYWA